VSRVRKSLSDALYYTRSIVARRS